MTAPTPLEPSWSIQQVCDAWGLSPDRLRFLMRTGQIGYIKAGHSRRMLAEHIGQLRALLEVKPVEEPARINRRRSVPRRRSA